MRKSTVLVPLLWATCTIASAQLSVMVAVEPTAKKDSFMVLRANVEKGLGQATGQTVTLITSEDLAEVMRSTRSAAGFDIYIAPAQVAASALLRGYDLVGSSEANEQYVLVGRQDLAGPTAMKGGRLYLPAQDSIYSYMARGMLNASGLSFKDMRTVEHARYPLAGLVAVNLGMYDATVVRKSEWEQTLKTEAVTAKVLATSGFVPGGFSVVIKKSLAPETRAKAMAWLAAAGPSVGLKPLAQHAELASYKAVAELGYFTPTQLPGAIVVGAKEVQDLLSQGVALVDTRSEKEYKTKHVPGAVFVPYHEKSLKDVAFDPKADDFSGLDKLDASKPVIFACNGAECWKSYKASRVALAKGFKRVYWFRGGLPEWETTAPAPITVARQG